MTKQNLCNFFNKPGGCRRGDSCTFVHSAAAPDRNSQGKAAASFKGVPAGVCGYYWSSGACRREFECKFKHERPASSSRPGNRPPGASKNLLIPFLSQSGIAKLSGCGSDATLLLNAQQELDASSTHNYLQSLLRDEYRFRSTQQMSAFASLLLNASASNGKWSIDEAQMFMTRISTTPGNGLLRIGDILRYPDVSSRNKPKSLSFQTGYLPVLHYLSCEHVIKSPLEHHVNALYGQLDVNLDHVIGILKSCIADAMKARSFGDPSKRTERISGSAVFHTVSVVLFEYLTRFKNAVAMHQPLAPFVIELDEWFKVWTDGVSALPPTFDDDLSKEPSTKQNFNFNFLRSRMDRVVNMVNREKRLEVTSANGHYVPSSNNVPPSDALISALHAHYEGPGESRIEGRRHDNDFVDFRAIQVCPTDEELGCSVAPFLPANIPNAPHPFPSDSMERLLDIQFRLLREEMIAPLRHSVQLLSEDLRAPRSGRTHGSQLDELRKKRGGRYYYEAKDKSIMFNVYTGAEIDGFSCETQRGMVANLRIDTPPGSARKQSANARVSFWKGGSGKRLMQGGLFALLLNDKKDVRVHLGQIISTPENLAESARQSGDKLVLKCQFFDTSVTFTFLEARKDRFRPEMVLIESPVMFESIRPFLDSLKREPESFPFKRYLVHPSSGSIRDLTIEPPRYSTSPDFSFTLDCLVKGGEGDGPLRLRASDASSVGATRSELKARSFLDDSQVDALVDSLTREVALIQGPPGTGKTFIGIELIRVLVESKALPILLIAFTNHALDHMLGSVLDAGITKNIIRLGGRSADEKIQQYSLGELEKTAPRSRFALSYPSEHKRLKDVETRMETLMKRFWSYHVPQHAMGEYLSIQYPDFFAGINEPPEWISVLYAMQQADDSEGDWETVDRGKGVPSKLSLYLFWHLGKDLDFLRTTANLKENVPSKLSTNRYEALTSITIKQEGDAIENSDSDSDSDSDSEDIEASHLHFSLNTMTRSREGTKPEPASILQGDHRPQLNDCNETSEKDLNQQDYVSISDLKDVNGFFAQFGLEPPTIPVSDRSVEAVLDDLEGDVWKLSMTERGKIHEFWTKACKEQFYQTEKDRFKQLSEEHAFLREKEKGRKDEMRLNIMRKADVIGCTTTGAAKLTALLKGIGPRVMIVEEAGQVLESHILANLIDSIHHLILIGDPLQLRPTLNNYGLSMDNALGRRLYKFDMSLMERLSSTGLPMSRLNEQRRMRPTVSSLIRNTLYKGLLDHDVVKVYPDVRGFSKNVYFFDHNNKETGGGDDSISKHNLFEVAMIKDLVKYLLRQGTYSAEGGIVVLCGYLGQLAKVRDALSSEVVVLIDERDQKELADKEGDVESSQPDATVTQVAINRRVKIRTVDNFQGEEADIVILSLVRNSGSGGLASLSLDGRGSANIGFFKSENRTNVAVSRAKHGLFILGNSNDFSSRSPMWCNIIDELKAIEAVGDSFPLACSRHPKNTAFVSEPGQFQIFAPDGGCLLPCDFRLKCGHSCPYKCHSDDENHINVRCVQPCTRQCSHGHPCKNICSDDCGKCMERVPNVRLPCGHVADKVSCHETDDLKTVFCKVNIPRDLPTCEHKPIVPCGLDLTTYSCTSVCGGKMTCCLNDCKARCFDCQRLNSSKEEDEEKGGQIDVRMIRRAEHKRHRCQKSLVCGHQCSKTCSADHVESGCNSPCVERCRQHCVHSTCRLNCSDPCAPCKERCTWTCPHFSCPVPCGSVCVRLPCDKPCPNRLACGHPCPSVCGENCVEQLCLITGCPSRKEDKLDQIADFIMQRSLRDLNPSDGSVAEMTITLGCGHAFTVETLDGHCQMQDFYEQDDSGVWRRLKELQPDFRKPPLCPACRSPISSPRYGRVYKRAHLDLLETNVASHAARALHTAQDHLSNYDISRTEAALKDAISRTTPGAVVTIKKSLKKRKAGQGEILNSHDRWNVSWKALSPGNGSLHGVSSEEAKVWDGMVGELMQAYMNASTVASTRSAHWSAWESSFNFLYNEEIERAAVDLQRAPRNPEEHAMRVARIKIGQPKPTADRRFCVEAFWISLDIRFSLVKLAKCWFALRLSRPDFMAKSGGIWSGYIDFVLKSCKRDANVALEIAEESQSRRQVGPSKVFVMRSDMEYFKHSYHMRRMQSPMSDEVREKFRDRALEYASKAKDMIREEQAKGRRDDEREYHKTTFLTPAALVLEEWKSLAESVMDENFFEPLSSDEKLQVIQAMKQEFFNVAGHFYRCPNGHLYTIGDCGGATETSRCPECGEMIGGGAHQLLATNQRDLEFERIAREQAGYDSSPHPWNQF